MFRRRGRKAFIAALTVTGWSVPALANDPLITTHQTSVGQAATQVSPARAGSTVAQEPSATESSGTIPAPQARLGGPRGPVPPLLAVRQPSVVQHTPLILGIGF